MLAGKVTNEPHDLTGLAETVRQVLWHRERSHLLLADARHTCEQRAAERDQARLERDAVSRELARALVTHPPAVRITAAMVSELRQRTGADWRVCKDALNACDGDMDRAVDLVRDRVSA
jgi:hypothetical protein